MAALLRLGARRIGGSVLQRTQATVSSPAVAEERRRLVPRRMLNTCRRAPETSQEELQKEFGHLKPYQICWEVMRLFPGRKIIKLVAATTLFVTFASASRRVKEAEKEREQRPRVS